MEKEEKTLTARQKLFVELYLISLNAAQAARDAGFANTTANKKAPLWVGKSRESCPENMRHVWDAVYAAIQARAEKHAIDADWVLKRAVQIFETSISSFLVTNKNGMPYFDLSQATDDQLAAIESLQLDSEMEKRGDDEPVEIRKIRLSLPKKKELLDLIGRHIGVQAFKEIQERKITGEINHTHTVKDQMDFNAIRDKVDKHKPKRLN